ncbi:MAG: PD-(D/E)XK nuclease family protein [Planctomycetota bacterium]|nr:PD-(D/E)XK nuclease family protein [Planctomycetota bacterium]
MSLPTRVFLGWNQPTLARAADWLLNEHGMDLGEVTLVLPGRRAGRRLMELLTERADANWTPPTFMTLAQLSDGLAPYAFARAGDPLRSLAWIAALQEVPTDDLHSLIPHAPSSKDLEAWWPVAEMLRALHSELAAEALCFRDVLQVAEYLDTPRWEVLANLQERFVKILEECACGDPHFMRLQALKAGRVENLKGALVVLGLPEANALQRGLLKTMDASWTCLIAAPEELADHFDELGFVEPSAWQERPLSIEPQRVHICADAKQQAEEVLTCLRTSRGTFAAEEITLGVLEAAHLPALESALAKEGVGVHAPNGLHGSRTPPAHLLRAIAAWLQNPKAEELAAVLRHPDMEVRLGEELEQPVDAAALDAYRSEHLALEVGPNWLSPNEECTVSVVQHATIRKQSAVVWKLTESLRGPALTAADWAPLLVDWLSMIYASKELDRSQESDRRLGSALEACAKALMAWSTLPTKGATTFRLTGAEAIRLLLRDLSNTEVPPGRSEETSMDAVGWLELPLDDAPALLLTDFQEGHAPAVLRGSALLDSTLRKQLQMPDDITRWARDRYLVEWLLHSRGEKNWPQIFLCRRDLDGSPLQPSRFLFLGEEEQVIAQSCALFAANVVEESRRGVELPTAVAFPGPQEGLEYETETFSCSRLNGYLSSPYSYYLKHVLRLNDADDRARELDPLHFGVLLHDVLEHFGSDETLRELQDAEEIRKAVVGFLHEEAAKRYGEQPRSLVQLQLIQAEHRLALFAQEQAKVRAEGWEIHAVEWSPEGKSVPLEFEAESFRVGGRIDRIDRRVHGASVEWRIIDYKSGDKKREQKDCWMRVKKQWMDIQLAIYPYLARSLTGGRGPAMKDGPVSVVYWNLGAHESSHGMSGFYLDDEMLSALENQVASAVRGIRAAKFFEEDQPRIYRSPFAMRCMGGGLLVSTDGTADDEEEGA